MTRDVHLFASQRVNRKARTDNDEVFREKVTLITNNLMNIGKLSDFAQLVADMGDCGILIGEKRIVLKADQVKVYNGTTEVSMFANNKLNANLIDADKIEVKHLWAKSEDGTANVGYFGNTENMEACKVDDTTYAPLFVGADNAKNAPFHVTQDGAIYALTGRIGRFILTDNGILEYDDGYNTTHKPMQLSENSLFFTHTTDHTTNDRIIWIGTTKRVSPIYGISNLISDIRIDDREYRPDDSKACLVLHAEGGTREQSNYADEPSGNFAICASRGMYAGLRPVTRKVNKSITLSDMDCFVIVTKVVTITLPAKPQRGQYYKFLQLCDNFVIKSSLNNMCWHKVCKNSFTSGLYNQTTELIYDGSNWNVNWFMGK